jgi:hypothetical protein
MSTFNGRKKPSEGWCGVHRAFFLAGPGWPFQVTRRCLARPGGLAKESPVPGGGGGGESVSGPAMRLSSKSSPPSQDHLDDSGLAGSFVLRGSGSGYQQALSGCRASHSQASRCSEAAAQPLSKIIHWPPSDSLERLSWTTRGGNVPRRTGCPFRRAGPSCGTVWPLRAFRSQLDPAPSPLSSQGEPPARIIHSLARG